MKGTPVKYMMLIGGSEDGWDHLSSEEQDALYARIGAWWGEQSAAGSIVEGHQLQPAATATTVRIARDGGATVTDGPFVEGKEIVSGFVEIEVADLDEALAMARCWPGCPVIEIRPVDR